jgi:hypothetical protein
MNTLKPVFLRPVVKLNPPSIEARARAELNPSCPYSTADAGPVVQTHRTVVTTSFSGSQRNWGDTAGEPERNTGRQAGTNGEY